MNPQAAQAPAGLAVSTAGALIECMRPLQWIKNAFVLSPLLFSGKLTDPRMNAHAAVALVAFCLAASGVYLWNDSMDWRSDARHPEKCNRPIPSGRLSPFTAVIFGSLLIAMAATAGFLLNAPTGALITGYAGLNMLYSRWLKHLAIVDLMCIGAGFVIRVIAGATAIDVMFSHWLLMCTFLLALLLAIAKRRQELNSLAEFAMHRRVLESYSLPWLDQAATVVSAAAIVAYALYAVSPETQSRFGTDRLIYTLPFVLFGILRYLGMVHTGNRTGNPTAALLTDKQLLICVSGWVLVCAMVIYL
jgi:4-hydroxybenzoate polyprenyltransferase